MDFSGTCLHGCVVYTKLCSEILEQEQKRQVHPNCVHDWKDQLGNFQGMVKQKDKDDEPRVLECAWGAGEMMLFSR